jgi:hypothetical protein
MGPPPLTGRGLVRVVLMRIATVFELMRRYENIPFPVLLTGGKKGEQTVL